MNRLVEYVQSFAVIGLVLFAVVGISYHLFRDDGWIETILGGVWGAAIRYPLIVLPAILAAVWFGMMWSEKRSAHGTTSKIPDIFIYLLMAVGLVFFGRWIAYGTL